MIVSLAVPALLFLSLAMSVPELGAMAAGALAANALAQAAASLWSRRIQPGTLPGLLLMLPASIWLIVLLDTGKVWPLAGAIAMMPSLALVWLLAALLAVGQAR
ncbi:hypothetical protein [Paracoccus albus]|uniref:hypothetical protein n=1 Tax=Paracoccus albus TaxID=3017784 RepID=UPI0022F11C04|nr:hypothetical protein [Paracoccus albus]WBU61042.1 hypothetical protein PAF20_03760 [Paracoccus albus]